jgi:hypothetical protein
MPRVSVPSPPTALDAATLGDTAASSSSFELRESLSNSQRSSPLWPCTELVRDLGGDRGGDRDDELLRRRPRDADDGDPWP